MVKVPAILHICAGSGADPGSGRGFMCIKWGTIFRFYLIFHNYPLILEQFGLEKGGFKTCDKYQKLVF